MLSGSTIARAASTDYDPFEREAWSINSTFGGPYGLPNIDDLTLEPFRLEVESSPPTVAAAVEIDAVYATDTTALLVDGRFRGRSEKSESYEELTGKLISRMFVEGLNCSINAVMKNPRFILPYLGSALFVPGSDNSGPAELREWLLRSSPKHFSNMVRCLGDSVYGDGFTVESMFSERAVEDGVFDADLLSLGVKLLHRMEAELRPSCDKLIEDELLRLIRDEPLSLLDDFNELTIAFSGLTTLPNGDFLIFSSGDMLAVAARDGDMYYQASPSYEHAGISVRPKITMSNDNALLSETTVDGELISEVCFHRNAVRVTRIPASIAEDSVFVFATGEFLSTRAGRKACLERLRTNLGTIDSARAAVKASVEESTAQQHRSGEHGLITFTPKDYRDFRSRVARETMTYVRETEGDPLATALFPAL